MPLLLFGIGLRDCGPGLPQPESQLAEQALALPHTQFDAVLAFDPTGQGLAIPQIPAQADVPWHAAQDLIHFIQLPRIQPPRSARPFAFQQPSQTHFLKCVNPIFDSSRRIPQHPGNFRAGHALCNQQHPVETVIIPGFLRSPDLFLQSQDDGC